LTVLASAAARDPHAASYSSARSAAAFDEAAPGAGPRRWCAAAALLLGLAVLLGWASDQMMLTQLLPGLSAMNPMTALSLALGGAALAFHGRLQRSAMWMLGGLVAGIGVAKILQLVTGVPVGIDQLLFASTLDHALDVPPNRMAPNTAAALVVIGAALCLAHARSSHARLVSQGLAFLVVAITLFALIGYVLNLAVLYEMRRFNPMALHTAAGLLLLAIGTLSVNPGAGVMRVIGDAGPAGQLSRVVLPLVVLVPVLVGVFRLLGEKLGYYGTGQGVALQVFANVLVTFSLLMSSIAALYRSDLQRSQRELSINRSEAQYRLAEQMGHVGHWRLDLETHSMVASAEFRRICGLSDEAPLTTDVALSLHHPDDAQVHRHCLREAADRGVGWDGPRRIIHPGGEVRYIRSHGKAELDVAGRIVSLFGVFADITELELSRRQAEEATASKGAFLATMSHEIRTPLNAIIGFTDLLLDDRTLGSNAKRQLDMVKTSGGALLTVVNDILDFSKMEAGKVELDLRAFDLDMLIDDTFSIVRGTAEAKGLTLAFAPADSLNDYVLGDCARLRQILLNLLGNAIKFTERGSVTLTVRRSEGGNGPAVEFTIDDTGPGVQADKESRLFQQFSQADSSISREYGGTGLGLAICKSLTSLMGGRLGYRRLEEGSRFWFTAELPVTSRIPAVGAGPAAMSSATGLRILLVEDLPVNQELATAILTQAGHHVDIASDGHEAVTAVQQQGYDLILMDIQMPRMDGVTATKLIRLLPGKAQTVPILAMSANVLADQVQTFIEAGMNDHVGKPISRAALFAAISRHTEVRSVEQAPAASPATLAAFNQVTYESTAALLSAERLDTHLATFHTQLDALAGEVLDPGGLGALAHKLVNQSGLFGFDELAALCRDLDQCCSGNLPLGDRLERARTAAGPARSTVRRLRSDNYPGSGDRPRLAVAHAMHRG
jgi:PAS domain S-box-containing protein